ncbi:hypothetical protein Rhow_001793 [Rhodococcus wratislaviensis]|uniref:Uncharacterized protein n=1 Tax=Rhodococcus wratislaviensis TaxID=44752 RepID=A0A402BYK2_RHOWR|nr:hypothetical protein Rhow_001793 [Rhodococcus wratislaviensis]
MSVSHRRAIDSARKHHYVVPCGHRPSPDRELGYPPRAVREAHKHPKRRTS